MFRYLMLVLCVRATKCETSRTFVKETVLPSTIETASIKLNDNLASQITAVTFSDSGAKNAFRNTNRCYCPIYGKNGAAGLNNLIKFNWQRLGGCIRRENCRSLKGNWNGRANFYAKTIFQWTKTLAWQWCEAPHTDHMHAIRLGCIDENCKQFSYFQSLCHPKASSGFRESDPDITLNSRWIIQRNEFYRKPITEYYIVLSTLFIRGFWTCSHSLT